MKTNSNNIFTGTINPDFQSAVESKFGLDLSENFNSNGSEFFPLPIPTGDEIEKEQSFLNDLDWQNSEISDKMLDVTQPFENPKYLFSYNGVKFAPIGELHAFTGQPGNGKTMLITQFIVTVLKGSFGNLKYEGKEYIPFPTVLYVDTEMAKENTQLVYRRICEMLDWEPHKVHEQLKVMMLRDEDKPEDRWKDILKAIDIFRPSVVFIDGLLDLVTDFNSIEECHRRIHQCMRTASNFHISLWCVVHQNITTSIDKKQLKAEKMTGNLGSILARRVSDELLVYKDSGRFIVENLKARSKEIGKWEFEVVDGKECLGIPQMIDYCAIPINSNISSNKTSKRELNRAEKDKKIFEVINSLNIPKEGIRNKEFITLLIATNNELCNSDKKAQTTIERAVDINLVTKDLFNGISYYKKLS